MPEDTGPQLVDDDQDGYPADEDCDDDDAAIHPGAEEECDGVDNDCDGQTDEGLLQTWYADADGDGYGDASQSEEACEQGEGLADNGQDCDDGDADINPDAEELCNGWDDNCDGLADDEDPSLSAAPSWYVDADGDGWGNEDYVVEACE